MFDLQGIWRNNNSLLAIKEVTKNEKYVIDYFVKDKEKLGDVVILLKYEKKNKNEIYNILTHDKKLGETIEVKGDNEIKVRLFEQNDNDQLKISEKKIFSLIFERKPKS